MSEADYYEAALTRDGIACVYYPPNERNGKPILETRETVELDAFRVDAGRWTDGGSVPTSLHSVAHPFGYLFRAFLIHDTSLFDGLGWKVSNGRFNVAMRALGAPTWQRWAVMTAVKTNAKWQRIRAGLGWRADYVD